MEYQALYRKYRPKIFEDVIGQEHITKTLKNQMRSNKISHAYLFCGTRGTGKTSTAKIFARAINCLQPVNGEPCMKCEMCVSDISGKSVNVIEIDAASNRGIDSIKELREDIKYTPSEGVYKVYIIDEIHMLTTEAFNALLKTLEEPPGHVVFILATTDPQKIPATILSRCQRFDFKRISTDKIAETIKIYLKKENIEADDDAVRYVSYLGDGSMRDSLSILDQCLAYFSDERITLEKILDITGNVDVSFYSNISEGIFEKDTQKVLEVLGKAMSMGREINQFVSGYISYLRDMLVVSTVENCGNLVDASAESLEIMRKQKEKTSVLKIMYMIERLSKLISELRYSTNPYILAEVEFIRFSSGIIISENSTEALEIKVSELENIIRNGNFVKVSEVKDDKSKNNRKKEKEESSEINDKPKADKGIPVKAESLKFTEKEVSEALAAVSKDLKIALRNFVSKAEIKGTQSGQIYLVCDFKTHADFINKDIDILKEKLAGKLGDYPNIRAIDKAEYEASLDINTKFSEDEEFKSMLKSRFSEEDAEDIVFLD